MDTLGGCELGTQLCDPLFGARALRTGAGGLLAQGRDRLLEPGCLAAEIACGARQGFALLARLPEGRDFGVGLGELPAEIVLPRFGRRDCLVESGRNCGDLLA